MSAACSSRNVFYKVPYIFQGGRTHGILKQTSVFRPCRRYTSEAEISPLDLIESLDRTSSTEFFLTTSTVEFYQPCTSPPDSGICRNPYSVPEVRKSCIWSQSLDGASCNGCFDSAQVPSLKSCCRSSYGSYGGQLLQVSMGASDASPSPDDVPILHLVQMHSDGPVLGQRHNRHDLEMTRT